MRRPLYIRPRRAKARAIARSSALPVREAVLALLAGTALAAAAMLTAPHATGQVFSSTPYTAAPDPAVEQLRKRTEELEGDLKRATDRSEKLAYDLSQTRKVAEDAKAAIVALTARVEALENGGGGEAAGGGSAALNAPALASASPAAPPSGGGNVAQGLSNRVDVSTLPQDEEGLLKEARNLLLDGNYPSAQQGFTTYLAKYGKGPNAHEAQYLLGESLLYQDNYSQAADAYGKLLSSYPKSPNGPNALVKLARSLRLMNKKADACKALSLMPQQFPKASDAAKQLASTERQRSNCK
jgi:tol-pal system protein YbgF